MKVSSKTDMVKKTAQYHMETGNFPLIQEEIPGDPSRLYKVLTVMSSTMKPLVLFTNEKIRQIPYDFGIGTYYESVFKRDAEEIGLKMFQALRCQGILSIELKLDPRDETFKIMEVNPRAPLYLSHPRGCGLNVPLILFNTFMGLPVKQSGTYRAGVRSWSPRRDLLVLMHERGRFSLTKEARSIIKALGVIRASDYFSLRDPLPFIVEFIKYFEKKVD